MKISVQPMRATSVLPTLEKAVVFEMQKFVFKRHSPSDRTAFRWRLLSEALTRGSCPKLLSEALSKAPIQASEAFLISEHPGSAWSDGVWPKFANDFVKFKAKKANLLFKS